MLQKLGKQPIIGVIGALVCIAAGLTLVGSQTKDADSYLMTIAHGMGWYFVGKGLFVLESSVRGSDISSWLERLYGRASRVDVPRA